MPTIDLGDHEVQYRIDRSFRHRRMKLVVTPKRSVYVTATFFDTDEEVARFVEEARDWLRNQLYPGDPSAQPFHSVADEQGEIRFRVTYNARRKRMSAYWRPESGLEVRSPAGVSMAHIKQFVLSNAALLRAHAAEMAQDAPPQRQWVSGETVPFLGGELTLQVVPHTNTNRAHRDGDTLTVRVSDSAPPDEVPHIVRQEVRGWLIKQAAAEINRRIRSFSEALGVSPGKVTIKDTRSRYGSCSSRGNISIAYRIVMAPPPVIDYLLWHELCHMRHPNHSREYWALMQQVMPDYTVHKQWLKDNSRRLTGL